MYIHYPWCRKLCPYCDFPVAVARPGRIPHEAYLATVLGELAHRARDFSGRQLVSVYFGGGTPSLWPARCLAQVVEAVIASLGATAASVLEVTIEANPADCRPEVMAGWRDAGINRLSVGVQSFDHRDLVTLGRDHRVGDGGEAIAAARDAGFRAVSADLIFGTPGPMSTRALEPSFERMVQTDCEHLSIYELTIEPRTMFGKAARSGRLRALDDTQLEAKYVAAHELLTAAGYEHYEISSYARPGYRSVHNSLYWNGGEFLGLGCGAASFRRTADGGAIRSTNVRSAPQYLRAESTTRQADVTTVPPGEVADDALWLALRTSDGAPDSAFLGRAALRAWLLETGLARLSDGRIRPTLRGFLCANQVAKRVVGA